MVQILNFGDAMHGRGAGARQQSDRPKSRQNRTIPPEDPFSFWPEVSGGQRVNQALPDPANSPARVFSEMFLILGGAGLLVLLTTAFFGAPQ